MFFRHPFRIGDQIILAFAVIFGACLVGFYYQTVALTTANREVRQSLQISIGIHRHREAVLEQAERYFGLAQGMPAELDLVRLEQRFEKLEQVHAALQNLYSKRRFDSSVLNNIDQQNAELFEKLHSTVGELYELSRAFAQSQAVALVEAEIDPQARLLRANIARQAGLLDAATEQLIERSDQNEQKIRNTIGLVVLLIMLVAMTAGGYLYFRLIAPLQKMTNFIRLISGRVSGHELVDGGPRPSVPFSSRSDEIGHLASSFQGLLDDARDYHRVILAEKKRAQVSEEEAYRQKHFLDKIIANLPVALFAKDVRNDYCFSIWNRKAEEIFGLPAEQVIGTSGHSIFQGDEAEFCHATDLTAMNSREVVEIDCAAITTARGTWLAHTIKVPIFDKKGKPELLLAMLQDITERRQMEENLRQSKILAEQANRAKTEFLANISHELRTPMHAIIGFAGYGEKKCGTLDVSALAENYAEIRSSGEELLLLIDDLLDLSKFEAGKIRFNFSDSFPYRIVCDVARELQPLLDEKELKLELTDFDTSDRILCDQKRLAQVFRNLLSNAIRFSRRGSVISIRSCSSDCQFRAFVCDRGTGIPEDELEFIFEKFIQSSKTTTGAGGTGLGLSICREIVKGHNGTIHAENNSEGGATFVVAIPKQQRLEP